jgi:hypothetical protein
MFLSIRYPRRSNVNTGFSVYISCENVYTAVRTPFLCATPSQSFNVYEYTPLHRIHSWASAWRLMTPASGFRHLTSRSGTGEFRYRTGSPQSGTGLVPALHKMTMKYPAIRIIHTNKQIVGLPIANPIIGSWCIRPDPLIFS